MPLTNIHEKDPGSPVPSFELCQAETDRQISTVRELFLEYAQSLGFSLCFQSFERELADLPGQYSPPAGRLLLAMSGDEAAGCVALHPLEPGICEMKRLYVRPSFRGRGLGKTLTEWVIGEAKVIGYEKLRLDTVEPVMQTAVAMYRKLGFVEITPYRANPIKGALYMELRI